MFFIFNKQKIYSYLVATSTIVILFVLSFFLINVDEEAVQTTTTKPENSVSQKYIETNIIQETEVNNE